MAKQPRTLKITEQRKPIIGTNNLNEEQLSLVRDSIANATSLQEIRDILRVSSNIGTGSSKVKEGKFPISSDLISRINLPKQTIVTTGNLGTPEIGVRNFSQPQISRPVTTQPLVDTLATFRAGEPVTGIRNTSSVSANRPQREVKMTPVRGGFGKAFLDFFNQMQTKQQPNIIIDPETGAQFDADTGQEITNIDTSTTIPDIQVPKKSVKSTPNKPSPKKAVSSSKNTTDKKAFIDEQGRYNSITLG